MNLAPFMKTKPPHLDRVAIAKAQYWRANIRVVLTLMGLWFLFGCVLSIFAVDALNTFSWEVSRLGFGWPNKVLRLPSLSLFFVTFSS